MKINDIKIADKGYYINLDTSVDRHEHINNLIKKYNITELERFSALTDDIRQFSCTKSHLKIFETALQENHEIIFVAEDDMDISEFPWNPTNNNKVSFFEYLEQILKDLESVEWDILLLGCNPKSHLIPITNTLAKMNRSTGAWAYLIKKRAYEFILNDLDYFKDYLAIDDFLPAMNTKGFITLTTIPMVIKHGSGFISTLQPNGPVFYDQWMEGNYHQFLYDVYPTGNFLEPRIEKYLTVVIAGHFVEKYPLYLDYLLRSLSPSLNRCKFLIHYDYDSHTYNPLPLHGYFRDIFSNLNVELSFGFGGLINTFETILQKVKTPYFLFLEHDWVFLENDNIHFLELIESFEKYKFMNAVWFSKDDNSMRGFEISRDVNGMDTPFDIESRVAEVNLITTCRWSNNPAIFRTSKMAEWYNTIIVNEHVGKIHQASYNVEEKMIEHYRKEISEHAWDDIRDGWGTFLYGKLHEGPFVAHTDASRRYLTTARSQPEINGDLYIEQHPIPTSVVDYFKIFNIEL